MPHILQSSAEKKKLKVKIRSYLRQRLKNSFIHLISLLTTRQLGKIRVDNKQQKCSSERKSVTVLKRDLKKTGQRFTVILKNCIQDILTGISQ